MLDYVAIFRVGSLPRVADVGSAVESHYRPVRRLVVHVPQLLPMMEHIMPVESDLEWIARQ